MFASLLYILFTFFRIADSIKEVDSNRDQIDFIMIIEDSVIIAKLGFILGNTYLLNKIIE